VSHVRGRLTEAMAPSVADDGTGAHLMNYEAWPTRRNEDALRGICGNKGFSIGFWACHRWRFQPERMRKDA